MQNLSIAIRPDAVSCCIAVQDKADLFGQIASLAERVYGLPAAKVAAALDARESSGTTGFGGGIAIPHARLEGLTNNIALFVSLEKPIDYQAVDGEPVDLAFALLSDPKNGKAHLRDLAEISRFSRVTDNLERLRGARNGDAIYAILNEAITLEAA